MPNYDYSLVVKPARDACMTVEELHSSLSKDLKDFAGYLNESTKYYQGDAADHFRHHAYQVLEEWGRVVERAGATKEKCLDKLKIVEQMLERGSF